MKLCKKKQQLFSDILIPELHLYVIIFIEEVKREVWLWEQCISVDRKSRGASPFKAEVDKEKSRHSKALKTIGTLWTESFIPSQYSSYPYLNTVCVVLFLHSRSYSSILHYFVLLCNIFTQRKGQQVRIVQELYSSFQLLHVFSFSCCKLPTGAGR